MADVPAWLLVFQTLAAGGVGLAGSFIVPKGQQVARAAERKAAAHAIMRDKAEQIFLLIGDLTTKNIAHLLRVIDEQTGRYDGEFEDMDTRASNLMAPLDGLIATYYPDGVSILAAAKKAREAALLPITDEIETVDGGIHSQAGRQIRVRLVNAAATVNAKYLRELQAFMLVAVRPYSPTAREMPSV
jgi:hypothetical protein